MSKIRLFKNLTKTEKANGSTAIGDPTLVTNPGRWHRQALVQKDIVIGTTTDTTDSAGEIVIEHGADFTPTWAMVTMGGDNQYIARVKTLAATTFTIVIKNDAGTDLNAGEVTVYWQVGLV